MRGFAVAVVPLVFCACGTALAQTGDSARYPTRPIRIIVPFGAGGPSDLLARTVAQKMTQSLGQQVITENRGEMRQWFITAEESHAP